ncbi:MAG TPA: pyrroloquinoline quinone precursor peptide PqqA, partial [Methylophaga sp.]|nr:pyrroloquinoline quinone precursor peptide PqqA [Methylophaga sp.]HCN99437.1 pyrroloquinoline quinone precursor peptide PqqA [Methylophaga sp.]
FGFEVTMYICNR